MIKYTIIMAVYKIKVIALVLRGKNKLYLLHFFYFDILFAVASSIFQEFLVMKSNLFNDLYPFFFCIVSYLSSRHFHILMIFSSRCLLYLFLFSCM